MKGDTDHDATWKPTTKTVYVDSKTTGVWI